MSQGWSEADSAAFLDHGAVLVPGRREQVATLVELVPAEPGEEFLAVELGAGGGALAAAVLQAFPRCRYVALDGSAVMRERLATRLAGFGSRVEARAFALEDRGWRGALPRPLRCVLASLVVHHLPGPGKRALFADLARALEPGGALLLADLVAPPDDRARRLWARQWDEAARSQSREVTGGLEALEAFRRDRWNWYADPAPDPEDQPSGLAEQLGWLREAGFRTAGCFWMRAGHAVYGGYR